MFEAGFSDDKKSLLIKKLLTVATVHCVAALHLLLLCSFVSFNRSSSIFSTRVDFFYFFWTDWVVFTFLRIILGKKSSADFSHILIQLDLVKNKRDLPVENFHRLRWRKRRLIISYFLLELSLKLRFEHFHFGLFFARFFGLIDRG